MLAARKVQVKSELLLNRLQDARLELPTNSFGIVRPVPSTNGPFPKDIASYSISATSRHLTGTCSQIVSAPQSLRNRNSIVCSLSA